MPFTAPVSAPAVILFIKLRFVFIIIIVLFAFIVKKFKILTDKRCKRLLKIGNYIKMIKYDYFFKDKQKMSKRNYKKSRLKYVFLAFTCATAFAFSGIAAACGDNSSETEPEKTTSKEDTQLLKNGNFEFFTVPEKKEDGNEPEYLIKAVDSWSHGGTGSYTMSGIISTSETAWGKISDPELADKLDYNNELDSSASNYLSEYVDYNGMKSSDLLYKDQYEALRSEDDYKEGETIPENRKDRIANPKTHYNVTEKNGKLYTVDGDEVFVDENGEYFLEDKNDKGEYGKPISNVLMLHNYQTSHNGIAQNYSSVNVDLPANTAAEISVWVKTAHLKFSQGKDVTQDRGANITVTQNVGGSNIDKFMISCINTEKLLEEKKIDDKYNGWVQYTVYVNACDFAATTIGIELGLGEKGYTTEGYAFFDDVTVTKYVSLDQSESFKANADKLTDTTCNLSADESEKIYKVDSYQRNDGQVNKKQFSENFHYFIDLASETDNGGSTYTPVNFGNSAYNVKAGLTIDDDNYVSSKNSDFKSNMANFDYSGCRLPFTSDLKNNGLKTDGDYLQFVKTGYEFKQSDTEYYEKLNSALGGAANLPKNNKDNANNMLVMLSSYGAAYTTSFDLSVPRSGSDNDGYMIVSFWVKTSDMSGNTAATVKITQTGNDENTTKFTIDTTNKVTDIGDSDDEKDIYDGWVQCFFFVKNELEADDDTSDSITVEFSFGNTVISGTDVNSYKPGWVALANMQYLSVDEDIFSYTGSGDFTASLTISEEAEKNAQVFDGAYANQSQEIKKDMVNASSYKGVNGGSAAVKNKGHVSIPFDEFNNNADVYGDGSKFAGLINKEHFVDDESAYKDKSWYTTLLDNFNASGLDALSAWNKIFGEKSVQPLVITNKTRTSYIEEKGATKDTYKNYYVKNDDGDFEKVAADAEFDEKETYYSLQKVMNYGYIGENKQVSADGYSTISVRVKVSANAIAYVYLVDTSAGKSLLSFSAPTYSFYYDVEGNVLKAEPKDDATVSEQRANVLYTLRDDGLYEDKDGNLYANTWNYSKLYYIEDMTYYDESGKTYSIEDLVDGVTYYDEDGIEADHYLVTGDGLKIYQYIDGSYHYIVNGKTQSERVLPFDYHYARYSFKGVSEDYMVKIVGSEHLDKDKNPEWVTVTFVVHAGSAAKSYRLELWSGERTEYTTEGNKEGGAVIFDYSYTSVSSDDAKNEYEQEIINAYLNVLSKVPGALDTIDTTGENIAFFEELVEKLLKDNPSYKTEYPELLTINPYNYKSHYYTYSLYDSADFQPFNKTTASDGATGYDYSVADQSESLAYLQVNDGNEYSVFVDYSAIDKSISLNNPTDSDNDDEDDGNKGSDGSIWLLASSIILVVALLFAIVAIFLRDAIKKARRNKVTSKNTYDQRKANRYKRKLHLTQEETIEVDANGADAEAEVPAKEVEEVPAAETVEETADEVEETTPDEPSDDNKE